jgi:hypothetical protein
MTEADNSPYLKQDMRWKKSPPTLMRHKRKELE